MTPASIAEIMLPLLTQFNVDGMMEPVMEEPRTNRGNREVRRDRISSVVVVVAVVDLSSSLLLLVVEEEEVEDNRSNEFVLL